ncbi:hypothetical protein HYT02_03525 [Candidatus Gottesmanbacteria bacterium]|nr:hypothetical protein [Candidatus Gottesmanbacteria bacterium]
MHSFIILGTDRDKVENSAREIISRYKIKKYNLITVDDTSIKSVREKIIKLINNSQKQEFQALVINEIGKLREDAQQTLLKTLEEPPVNTICIIMGTYSDFILPTILSRSQIIPVNNKQVEIDVKEFSNYWQPIITATGLSEKLIAATRISQDYSNKNLLLDWLDRQILFFRSVMYKRTTGSIKGKMNALEIGLIIKNLLNAKRYISGNVNTKLVIDNLLLSLPSK